MDQVNTNTENLNNSIELQSHPVEVKGSLPVENSADRDSLAEEEALLTNNSENSVTRNNLPIQITEAQAGNVKNVNEKGYIIAPTSQEKLGNPDQSLADKLLAHLL